MPWSTCRGSSTSGPGTLVVACRLLSSVGAANSSGSRGSAVNSSVSGNINYVWGLLREATEVSRLSGVDAGAEWGRGPKNGCTQAILSTCRCGISQPTHSC
ncbi:unnamed protein product [Ectocarpus sp. 12 AP-2014]